LNLLHARSANGKVAAMVRHDDAPTYSPAIAWARRLALPCGRLLEIDPGPGDCLNEFRGV
jgi:hypothetical protein